MASFDNVFTSIGVDNVDASPAVVVSSEITNLSVGQATTLTHRDSFHYDISGR